MAGLLWLIAGVILLISGISAQVIGYQAHGSGLVYPSMIGPLLASGLVNIGFGLIFLHIGWNWERPSASS